MKKIITFITSIFSFAANFMAMVVGLEPTRVLPLWISNPLQ